MEASLIDMTRGLDDFERRWVPDLEIGHHADDDEYDVVIEYVFESAAIEDAFSDPWFAVRDDALATDEGVPLAPLATPGSLHAVLGFAAAVALAAGLYAATL